MTVAELIEKLSTYNPNRRVLIELVPGDVRCPLPSDVKEMNLNEWGSMASEEEEGVDYVVIKA
tara:strand:- start:926 stop:1114 length:189 start_codon:yes stop_codon:yes gene_type:complete